jgi:putative ABC transport system permease protein
MFAHFLKTALRYLKKNPSFALINIIGLTAGLTAFILIALYLQNELSYDRHFPEADRMYRLVGEQEPTGIDVQHVAITSGGWAPFVRDHVPDVEEIIRIQWAPSGVEAGEEEFREVIYYSEGKVLELFGLPVLEGGDAGGMLTSPRTAVISREAALRLFKRSDVVGETLRHNGTPYTITGVFENEGLQSHLGFDLLLSFITVENDNPFMHHLGNNSLANYLLLREGADPERVASLLNDQYRQYTELEGEDRVMKNTFYLQPAGDIYLRSGDIKFHMYSSIGSLSTVYVFILVAVLVLAIACINFINLATAHSVRRAREVGVRKVMGAGSNTLAIQFIGESLVIVLAAIVFSLVMIEVILPEFNSLLGTTLRIDFAGNPLFNIGLLGLWLVVGLASGLYPGLFLSKFQATEVLKSASASGRPQAAWLRKILVVVQFAVSAVLIVSTIIVMQQIRYMQHKDRGYRPDDMVYLAFSEGTTYEQILGFRNHLAGRPEVVGAGIASQYNGVAGQQSTIVAADSAATQLMARFGFPDPDFFPLMEIDVVAGRNFSREAGTDYMAAMVNEATCRAFGWDDPVGQRLLNIWSDDFEYFTIIGVVRDYNYFSLHQPIQPAVFFYDTSRMLTLNIRYRDRDPQDFLTSLEEEFREFFPGRVFNGRLVNEVLSNQTRSERNTRQLFAWFSALCIIISCLGLFGLTAFMMNQRRKEIAVRKVLGSTVARINLLLMGGFMRLVGLAAILATPVAYMLMGRWLDNYPYRIGMNALHFAVAFLLLMAIASATVMIYSTRAARQNPVDHLKYE